MNNKGDYIVKKKKKISYAQISQFPVRIAKTVNLQKNRLNEHVKIMISIVFLLKKFTTIINNTVFRVLRIRNMDIILYYFDANFYLYKAAIVRVNF